MEFSDRVSDFRSRIEAGIDRYLPAADTRPERLHEAMRYSIQAGGKRLRPILVLAAADIFASGADPLPAAVAFECVHTYSLIHDDLPCMDNDDLRRGRPTCHRQFDEATATLAGDALLTHAFSLLASEYRNLPALAIALIDELASAAGSRRLIGGQMEDILAENREADAAILEFIHANKTAALLSAALAAGGLVGGADPGATASLRAIGRHLGLAFQIVDDILDATGDPTKLGKTPGKDARDQKTTYLKVHGLEASRRQAAHHTQAGAALCRELPGNSDFLVRLLEDLEHRIH